MHHASQSSPLPLVEHERLCVCLRCSGLGKEKKKEGRKEKKKNLYLAIHKRFHSKILRKKVERKSEHKLGT